MSIPDKKYIHSITCHPSPYNYIWETEKWTDGPPSDETNTGFTIHDAFYAIGYPGPVLNHLDLYYINLSN